MLPPSLFRLSAMYPRPESNKATVFQNLDWCSPIGPDPTNRLSQVASEETTWFNHVGYAGTSSAGDACS